MTGPSRRRSSRIQTVTGTRSWFCCRARASGNSQWSHCPLRRSGRLAATNFCLPNSPPTRRWTSSAAYASQAAAGLLPWRRASSTPGSRATHLGGGPSWCCGRTGPCSAMARTCLFAGTLPSTTSATSWARTCTSMSPQTPLFSSPPGDLVGTAPVAWWWSGAACVAGSSSQPLWTIALLLPLATSPSLPLTARPVISSGPTTAPRRKRPRRRTSR
mmetsp:Transcript_8175/g.23252  ORF Transcript_8175/g.23252 Transcript_8175/m.23252 type:complete len:216 (-) Transcript_8175:1494-2141(-)